MKARYEAGAMRVLGEQDGPPERALKDALAPLLRSSPGVRRAWLARVAFGTAEPVVALCLAGPKSPELAESIGRVFATQFRADAFLDIFFLSAAQEVELGRTCQPFFVSV